MGESKVGGGEPAKAYVRVIDYFKEEVRAGRLQVGSKLPPERVLAERLGIGRSSVREALRVLEIMGTTVSTQGAGNYIARNFEPSLVEMMSLMFLLHEISFRQVSQLRRALELEAFSLAVENASRADIDRLNAIIGELDQGPSEARNVQLDKSLHYAIAQASGNELIVEILQALSDVMDRFIADLRRDIMADAGRKQALNRAHRQMAAAIAEGNLAEGRAAVEEHFSLIDQQL